MTGPAQARPATPAGDPAASPAGAAADELPGDAQRTPLPDRVLTYWRVSALIGWAPFVLGIGAAVLLVSGIPGWLQGLVIVALLAAVAIDLAVVQPLRHRTWWYAIGEEQVDLQHGWPFTTRTVVPMVRVQHVQLERGPLADRFTLAKLEIHSAAGAIPIPALDRAEGERIRQRIAELARITDDL